MDDQIDWSKSNCDEGGLTQHHTSASIVQLLAAHSFKTHQECAAIASAP